MDYSDLLRGAWQVARRHKYLWLLGLFATEGGCGLSGGSSNIRGSFGGGDGSLTPDASGFGDWITHNWALLAALLLGLLALGIALWVISIISTGGLIAGSDAAHAGVPSGLGAAWRAGVRNFWRLFGMWLLVFAVALVVVLVILLAIGLPLGLALARGVHLGTGAIIAIVLAVLALIVLAIPVAIVAQVVLTWASRSLVLEGTGPVNSIRAGWRVFRSNVGKSLMVWLINVGISIAAGIALLVPLALIAIPVGVMVYRAGSDGGSGAMWAIIAVGGLVLLAILALFKAAFTTFSTAYWTIAYRRLTSPPGPPAAPLGPQSPGLVS